MSNTQPYYKILLVDDHVLLRDALASLLGQFEDFKVLGVASNGLEMMDHFDKYTAPDIIILDLNMPEMDGYQCAHWLQEHHPDVKIIVLTMYDSEIALIRLLQTGVRGFMKKDIHPTELRRALLSVLEDGYYYAQQTTGKLANLFKRSLDQRQSIEKSMLTTTEIEFLKLACSEMTYKEIAGLMNLTPRVVDSYRDALFEKLDVKSRVGLAIYAVKNGVVTF